MSKFVIISGGQSGADLGGVYGARKAGVEHRVRTFKGFKPVNRPCLPPELPVEYLAIRDDLDTTEKLRVRTWANVQKADGTVVFIYQPVGDKTRGTWLTINQCVLERKPVLLVNLTAPWLVNLTLVKTFMRAFGCVNVAGQRGCSEELVASYVAEALRD